MKLKVRVLKAFAVVISLAFCLSARADSDDQRAREAGPEDGFLCCNGIIPFLFHGDNVLTTTGRAGIFRSEHRGESWQRSMKGLVAPNGVSPFVASVCGAPSDPRIVYALAGADSSPVPFNGLFSSEDFGKTWTRRAEVPTENGFADCSVDPDDPRTVYVNTLDLGANVFQVWRSTDGGETAQIFGTNLPACAAGCAATPLQGILYVGVSEAGLYASTDRGVSFYPVPLPPGFRKNNSFSPDGHAIFIYTEETEDPSPPIGTFRSIDGGASYIAVSGLPHGFSGPLAFDPTNPSRIYASAPDGLLHVSTDGGLSFTVLPASNDPRFLGSVREISVDARGSVYINTYGGPFRTDDGGQTFCSLLDDFRATSVNDLAFDAGGNLLVGANNTQPVFQQTHGLTFRPIGATIPRDSFNSSSSAASVAGSPTDANVVLVATRTVGLFRTTDGGHSWMPASGLPDFLTNSRMAFPTGSRVYLAFPAPSPFFQPGFYRSDDAGQSFARLSSLPFGAIAVDPANPDVLYLGVFNGGAGLFKSADGGQTVQSLGQPGTFSAVAVDRRNSQVIYAGERFGQVIRSLDGGQTFAPANTGLAGAGVHGFAQDAHGTLFVWLRGGGLFASHDSASSWRPVDTGEALQRSGVEAGRGSIVADPRHPGRVYLGNAGVIQLDTGDDAGDHDD